MGKITFQFIADASEEDQEVFLTVLTHQSHAAHTVTSGVYCIDEVDSSEIASLLDTLNESPLIEYAIVPPDTDQ